MTRSPIELFWTAKNLRYPLFNKSKFGLKCDCKPLQTLFVWLHVIRRQINLTGVWLKATAGQSLPSGDRNPFSKPASSRCSDQQGEGQGGCAGVRGKLVSHCGQGGHQAAASAQAPSVKTHFWLLPILHHCSALLQVPEWKFYQIPQLTPYVVGWVKTRPQNVQLKRKVNWSQIKQYWHKIIVGHNPQKWWNLLLQQLKNYYWTKNIIIMV